MNPHTVVDEKLHEAIEGLANQLVYLAGPTIDGRPTRYLPCNACAAVVPVGPVVLDDGRIATALSVVCEECSAPCENTDCGLSRHEHRECEACDGTGQVECEGHGIGGGGLAECNDCGGSGRGPCEPKESCPDNCLHPEHVGRSWAKRPWSSNPALIDPNRYPSQKRND